MLYRRGWNNARKCNIFGWMDIQAIPCLKCLILIACLVYLQVLSVKSALYKIQCTIYNVQFTVCNGQFTMQGVPYTMYNVQYTVYSIQCTVFTVHITWAALFSVLLKPQAKIAVVYRLHCYFKHLIIKTKQASPLIIYFFFPQYKLLADPGEARGCSINSLVIDSLINWFSQPFPPTALQRRHAQTVRDSISSYKIDYVKMIKNSLNPEGHQNPISGSKVTAILLKWWILPIVGASSGRVCACSLRSRLVYRLWPWTRDAKTYQRANNVG